MSRKEFPSSVRMAAKARCEANGWLCETGTRIVNGVETELDGCGLPIIGRPDYDHIRPDGLGGEPTLENCQVICSKCHKIKTHERDRPVMAKADRQMKSATGLKPKGRGFRGWTRMDGTPVWRDQ